MLKKFVVVFIENFVHQCFNQDGNFIIGHRYQQRDSIYSYPLPSIEYEFSRVCHLSDSVECWPLTDVKFKAIRLPNFLGSSTEIDGTYAVFSLLMEENN